MYLMSTGMHHEYKIILTFKVHVILRLTEFPYCITMLIKIDIIIEIYINCVINCFGYRFTQMFDYNMLFGFEQLNSKN